MRAVGNAGGTNAEVIVIQPIGGRAGADVGVGSLVLGTDHGLTEAGTVDAPVGSLAAVAHGEEVLVDIGQVVDVAVGEAWARPTGVAAVGSVVGETDTGAQVVVATTILTVAVLVNIVETVFLIVIVVGGIPNGRTTHGDTPTGVFTCDDQHVAEVTRHRQHSCSKGR